MKRVLIVDDSETVRLQVVAALSRAGFTVVEAVDGMDALDRLAHDDFALAILDVNMPRMNGLELLEKMQSDARHRKLAVLMLTTEAQHAMIDRARKLGARGWMIKPIKPEQLIATVTKLTA